MPNDVLMFRKSGLSIAMGNASPVSYTHLDVYKRQDVISSALYARFRSRQEHTFGEKMLSAMRFGFGGHIEGEETTDPQPKPEDAQTNVAARNAAE